MGRGLQRKAVPSSGGLLAGAALALAFLGFGCASPGPDPEWIRAFGYARSDVHSIEVGRFGYPYVRVDVAGTRLMLPFDTGNMVGVCVSSKLFGRMGLRADESWHPHSSAGRAGASLRVAGAVEVALLGRTLGRTRVYEIDHPGLDGLVGPIVLAGGHFTLDYASRRMALGEGGLPAGVPGFTKLPLVRSRLHPLLVLVRGTVDGRRVLLELDTGKSRTVINPALASALALERGPQGAVIRKLNLGHLSFEVPNAKEVDQTGIDADLPEPILGGIGSDILSRFVWTADYEGGALWIPSS